MESVVSLKVREWSHPGPENTEVKWWNNDAKSVMIAQWDSSLSVLPVARVQFPAMAEYFKGFFPGWSRSANPSWASVAENGSISPQWHHTTCGQRGGRPKFNHGQTMADRKNDAKSWAVFLYNSRIIFSCRFAARCCLSPIIPSC